MNASKPTSTFLKRRIVRVLDFESVEESENVDLFVGREEVAVLNQGLHVS